MAKAGAHAKYLERHWPEQIAKVRELIELMRSWTTERCEIFATAYAAWNDLLIWGREPSDEAILEEILSHWHDSKRNIPESRWRKAIEWTREHGYEPVGYGFATRKL